MLDFTNKDTVRQFILENDIRDIVQLNSMLFQFLVFSLRSFLKQSGTNTWAMIDTSKQNSRRLTPEMVIPRRKFVLFMARLTLIFPEIEPVHLNRRWSRSINGIFPNLRIGSSQCMQKG